MGYAVVKTGGKQYKVSEGSILEIDRLNRQKENEIILDDVLLWVFDGQVKIGKPNLSGIKIRAKVLDHIKGKKIKVAKFKAKARHRRSVGFRPLLTRLEIKKIETSSSDIKSIKSKKTSAKTY